MDDRQRYRIHAALDELLASWDQQRPYDHHNIRKNLERCSRNEGLIMQARLEKEQPCPST